MSSIVSHVEAIEFASAGLIGEAEIASPLDVYPDLRRRRTAWYGLMNPVLVVVRTSDGLEGIGMTNGGAGSATVINDHLSRVLIGRELTPDSPGELTPRLGLATLPYGRAGLSGMAVSGLDLALWDLAGKLAGAPVFEMLGGASPAPSVPAYVTGPAAQAALTNGFTALKVSMLYGPADGRDGILRNGDILRDGRAALGPTGCLMADAWMGWDFDFAIEMGEMLAQYGVLWLEEPLPPDQIEELATLRLALSGVTLIASGEHAFDIHSARRLAVAGAVDILQPDPWWMGGLSALRELATENFGGVRIIPHLGANPFTLHALAAGIVERQAEWYVATPPGTPLEGYPPIFPGNPLPHEGMISVSAKPGFGLEVDWLKVDELRRRFPSHARPARIHSERTSRSDS